MYSFRDVFHHPKLYSDTDHSLLHNCDVCVLCYVPEYACPYTRLLTLHSAQTLDYDTTQYYRAHTLLGRAGPCLA